MERKRKPGLRRLRNGLLALLAVLFLLLFLLTNNWFLRVALLPLAGTFLETPLAAEALTLSLWHGRLEARNLRVGEAGDPIATVQELRLHVSPSAWWQQRRIEVDDVRVAGATVRVLRNPDGSYRLPGRKKKKSPKPDEPFLLPDLQLRNLSLSNCTVTMEDEAGRAFAGLRAVNLSLPTFNLATPFRVEADGAFFALSAPALDLGDAHFTLTLTAEGLTRDLRIARGELKLSLRQLAGQIGQVPLNGREIEGTLKAHSQAGSALDLSLQLAEFAIVGGKQHQEVGLTLDGVVDPQRQDATLRLRAAPISATALNLLGTVTGGITVGGADGQATGELVVRGGTLFRASGELALRQFSLRMPGKNAPDWPALDLSLSYDATADVTAKSVVVDRCQGRLGTAQKDWLRLRLTEPLAIAMAASSGEKPQPAKLELELHDMDLALLHDLVPGTVPPRLRHGKLSGKLAAEVAQWGQQLDLAGQLTAELSEQNNADAAWPAVTAAIGFKGQCRELRNLELAIDASAQVAGQPALALALNGAGDLQTFTGKLSVELTKLGLPALALLPHPPGIFRRAQALDGSARLELAAAGLATPIAFTLHAQATGALATRVPQDGMGLAAAWDASGRYDLLTQSAQLSTLQMVLTRADQTLGNLQGSGTVALGKSGATSLRLVSDTLDLTACAALAPDPTAPALPAPEKSEKNQSPMPTSEPAPITALVGRRMDFDLQFKQVRYRELLLAPVEATLQLHDGVLEFPSVLLTVNGAPVSLDGRLAMDRPGWEYRLHAQAGDLPLAPLFNSLNPARQDCVSGVVTLLRIDAAGSGVTPASLEQNFHGGMSLAMANLRVHNWPGQNEWAEAMELPELKTIELNSIRLELVDEKGRLVVSEGAAKGHDLRLALSGNMKFDLALRLKTAIGVAGLLEKRLGTLVNVESDLLQLILKREDGALMLPGKYAIEGYLTRPKFDFNVKKITKSVTGEIGRNSLDSVLKTVLEMDRAGKSINPKNVLEELQKSPSPAPSAP